MALIFYPSDDRCVDFNKMSYRDRIATVRESAERYRDHILAQIKEQNSISCARPSLLQAAYNWDIIATLINEVRQMPEATELNKAGKAGYLKELAEVYATLRSARMPKLEITRLELCQEAEKLLHD
jgi:hypothetical protein